MIALAATPWASNFDPTPPLDPFHAGITTLGGIALTIFAGWYGLRFLRRLLSV